MGARGAARSKRTLRAPALCGMAGPLAFTLAWLVLGALRPGYDPLTQYISELAEVGGRYAPIMIAAFLLLGALTLAFAPGLHRGIGAGAGSPAGPLLVAIFGAGAIGSGLFRCDPGCAGVSLANRLHTLITYTGLGALTLATLVLPLRLSGDRDWRGYRWYSWLSGVAAIAIYLRGFETFVGDGLGQRLFIGVLFLWLGVMALRLYRLATEKGRHDARVHQPR